VQERFDKNQGPHFRNISGRF